MDVLGAVVRLQVQRSRLKPSGVYDPSPLLEVPALEVGPRGVVGLTESGPVLDVHHADHPDSRNRRLANGLSLLPRAHYDRMRARFGAHLVDGIAGESLLLDTPGPWDALTGDLVLETEDGGLLRLTGAVPAAPCVAFTRFCLRSDEGIEEALEELDHGTRGFYVSVEGEGRIEAGARLLRPYRLTRSLDPTPSCDDLRPVQPRHAAVRPTRRRSARVGRRSWAGLPSGRKLRG